jgi:hypothetical protein
MVDWFINWFVALVDVLQAYNGAITAIATVIIGCFTYVLAIVTNRQAKLTARSVRLAERALVELEGPILQVIDIFVSITNPLSNDDLGHTSHYKIKNYGRTPAVLREVSFQHGQLVKKFDAPHYGTKVKLSTFFGQGDTITMNPSDVGVVVAGFVYGYLTYSDIFGNLHTTGFGLSRASETDSWLISGGVVYNYHRVESDLGQ